MHRDQTVRFVAYFEAAKGALVLLAASGLLSLLHRDVYDTAVRLIEHLHLNPASKYPQIFLDAASKTGDARLVGLAAGATLYAAIRFAEAYGLFFERAWAEALAALSGALYIPYEIAGLLHKTSWHGVALLTLNIAVVALMVRALLRRRRSSVQGTS